MLAQIIQMMAFTQIMAIWTPALTSRATFSGSCRGDYCNYDNILDTGINVL